jgi:hypothetical protein
MSAEKTAYLNNIKTAIICYDGFCVIVMLHRTNVMPSDRRRRFRFGTVSLVFVQYTSLSEINSSCSSLRNLQTQTHIEVVSAAA